MLMLVKCNRNTDNIVTVPTDSDVISKPIHNWLKVLMIESYGLKDGVLIIKMKTRRVANEVDEEYSNTKVHFTTFCYINYNDEITKRDLNGEIISDLEWDKFLIKKEIQEAPPIKKIIFITPSQNEGTIVSTINAGSNECKKIGKMDNDETSKYMEKIIDIEKHS